MDSIRTRYRGRKIINKETGEVTYKPYKKTQLESDIEDAEDKLDNLCQITNECAWEDALSELEVLEKKQADFEADL